MKKIRIAQIGTNRYSHGPDIFRTLRLLSDQFEIAGYTWVEDERETCTDRMSAFDGYPELTLDTILNDPTIEAVTVETDEIHLLKYAQMAADHGKHIHMEKPGSQSLADFEKLIETVKAHGTVLHLGYMYRYNPFIADALTRAKNGELGEIFGVEAHMSRWDKDDVVEWLGSFRGGMMFYLGCHLIDLVLQLQGMPEKIIPLNCTTNPDTFATEDYAMAVFQYRNGVSFIRTCASEVGGGNRRQLVILGKKGTIEICPLEKGAGKEPLPHPMNFALRAEKSERFLGTPPVYETSEIFDRYETMIAAFAAMVRGEKENPYTYDYELTLFKTVLACCGVL